MGLAVRIRRALVRLRKPAMDVESDLSLGSVLRNGFIKSPLRIPAPLARPARRKDDGLRQVSWLADRRRCPPSQTFAQWLFGQRLTADSCGGSFGLAALAILKAKSSGTEFPIRQLTLTPVP